METYTFHQFPAAYGTVHIALFHNLSNASMIRQKLITAAQTPGEAGDHLKREVDFAFIDAAMLVSLQHLITALQMTLLLSLSPDHTPRTRSHNLHSEVLLTLHTNNIISEAIKKMGVSEGTTSLCVVRFGQGSQESVWADMERVVQGDLAPLSQLDIGDHADWKAIDKLYKLSELSRPPLTMQEIREKKVAAVINAVATKSVM